MTLAREIACCFGYFAVILAHVSDWLDDLSYQLLDGWLP
jgi:hypothetical protein